MLIEGRIKIGVKICQNLLKNSVLQANIILPISKRLRLFLFKKCAFKVCEEDFFLPVIQPYLDPYCPDLF